jgi:CubicO group peptidase (beta-lactamase class C family)
MRRETTALAPCWRAASARRRLVSYPSLLIAASTQPRSPAVRHLNRLRTAWTVAFLATALPAITTAQTSARDALRSAIDSIASAPIKEGKVAGMSVVVVQGNDTIIMRGYGLADLELDVPTPDRASYEIGSVTKQFTAAAILRLVEQGRVRLDAAITDYLPEYPTHGARITVRHLLNHTSGIHSYTSLPNFMVLTRKKMPRDSIVAAFKDLPLDFQPGEAMSYSNSAFFLLGVLIEKVSGRSYASYIHDSLFARAGMPDSRYCSENAVVKRRAHGYDTDSTGLVLAAYLDQSWPFSAGGLCSTVGDLAAWTRALHHGGILGPAAYRELISADTLNDGTRLRYAKGLAIAEIHGHPAIAHAGGIPGFLSELRYYPEADLTIAVLMNTIGPKDPQEVANAIADRLLPARPAVAHRLDVKPESVVGQYRGTGPDSQTVLTFARDLQGLTVQVDTGKTNSLTYTGNLTFAQGQTLFRFLKTGDGINAVRRDEVYGNTLFRRDGGTQRR